MWGHNAGCSLDLRTEKYYARCHPTASSGASQPKTTISASWCKLAMKRIVASFLREAMTEERICHIHKPRVVLTHWISRLRFMDRGCEVVRRWKARSISSLRLRPTSSSQQGRREDNGIEPDSNPVLTNRFDA